MKGEFLDRGGELFLLRRSCKFIHGRAVSQVFFCKTLVDHHQIVRLQGPYLSIYVVEFILSGLEEELVEIIGVKNDDDRGSCYSTQLEEVQIHVH